MNQIASNAGLKNTNYTNLTGLPDDQLFTSARDMAILSRALIKNFPNQYKMYKNKEFIFNDIKQYSRNKLLYLDDELTEQKLVSLKKRVIVF